MNGETLVTTANTGNTSAHAALTALPDPIVIADRQGRIAYLNPAAQTLLRQHRSSPIGHPLRTIMLLTDDHNGNAWDPLRACFKLGGKIHRDDLLLVQQRPGNDTPVSVSAVPLNNHPECGAMLVIRDISAIRAEVKALSDIAHLDPLTKLPNRNLFIDRLGQAMVQANRDERLVAVLFLDLDNFKGVNDNHGHEAGDILIKAVATRLRACIRSGDSVGRYAGDEFTVLLTNLHRVKDAVRIVSKIQHALSRPIRIRNAELPINASIGLSIYPADGDREDNLLRAADGAMYHAKQQGKTCARFFNADYNRMLPNQAMDEDQLRIAFDESQFQLHFQPRWDNRSHRITALEALLRWQHPTRGMVPAAEFLSLAEQNGFIRPLGNWALQEACRQSQLWRRAGLPEVPMVVNLSAHQFRHQDLPGLIGETIERFDIPMGSLEIDISEATLRNNAQLAIPALHRIRGLGATVCVSNFGSSCFSWRDLKQLPHHHLQIGRELIQNIASDPADAATAHAALAFAAELERPISAAGVETQRQRSFLRERGCHLMQGYLFSRPLPPGQIPALLAGPAEGYRASA